MVGATLGRPLSVAKFPNKWDVEGAVPYNLRCLSLLYRYLIQRFPHLVMDNKVAGAVHGSLVPIYQHKIIPLKISHHSCRRINCQRSSCNNKRVALSYLSHRFRHSFIIKPLLIKHNIRLYYSAAGAFWNACAV